MSIGKRLPALFLAVLLLCTVGVTAAAHNVPDLSRKGSITVTMHQGETVVSGGSLTLYRVGEVREEDGNYSFALTGDFTGCGQSLTNIQSAQLAKNLAQYVADHDLIGTTREINSSGTVTFPQLTLGLYLLVQNKAASGYNKAEPFLVSVPMRENGTYVYDVNASPKVEVEKASEPDNPSPVKPSSPTSPQSVKSQSKLPQTGQLNWPVPVLAVSGMCLFAIGWMLRSGKKKGSHET
ncbi:MAG: SpaA isopeptide-forming pilin-related protein [Candidatus Onthomonas sp.]|nr:SpaA isopeptide-forming pilin-related protein [Candidatus Onthomonas sp.]